MTSSSNEIFGSFDIAYQSEYGIIYYDNVKEMIYVTWENSLPRTDTISIIKTVNQNITNRFKPKALTIELKNVDKIDDDTLNYVYYHAILAFINVGTFKKVGIISDLNLTFMDKVEEVFVNVKENTNKEFDLRFFDDFQNLYRWI